MKKNTLKILAIDPGTTESAYVLWDGATILEMGKIENNEFIDVILNIIRNNNNLEFCIERVASYGMAVGQTTFDTCVWTGRFIQFFIDKSDTPIVTEVFRKDIKLHICGMTKAKDSNIIQALKDRFEPNLQPRKRPTGTLKGLRADIWQSFALAVYYYDEFVK